MSGYDLTVFRGSEDGSIKKGVTHKDKLEHDSVLLQVTHSGVCGTDLHHAHRDIVLGHEGVGVVKEIGPEVKQLKVGDRVGWGYQHDSCGQCPQCLAGRDTHCVSRHMYGSEELDQGSFAYEAIWREAFLFKLPDKLASDAAAPLMCGGATVFNVIDESNIRPTDRVGIIGVGGLGHLAIQFAAKVGCSVVVFSGSDSKKDEAIQLGATEFHATKGLKEIKLDGPPLDHLLITASMLPDWDLYMPILAPYGTIHLLTVSEDNLTVPYGPILSNALRIQGSVVAARHVHRRMLEFAAQHDIKPIMMKFPLNEKGIKDAMKTLESGKMRYRGVLEVEAA